MQQTAKIDANPGQLARYPIKPAFPDLAREVKHDRMQTAALYFAIAPASQYLTYQSLGRDHYYTRDRGECSCFSGSKCQCN